MNNINTPSATTNLINNSNSNISSSKNNSSNSFSLRRIFQRILFKMTRLRLPAILVIFMTVVPIILLIDPDLIDSLLNRLIGGLDSVEQQKQVRRHVPPRKINGRQENVTILEDRNFLDHDILVYNRVPKCGSIYMTRLLYLLGAGDRNQYGVQSPYEEGEKPFLTQEQQSKVVNQIEAEKKPLVYIRHQYFIDFEKFGKKRPIYINMIRDPIKRFESFYYFIRFGNEEGDGADVAMSEEKLKMTIDECVKKRSRECTEPKWQLVPYFCGHDPRCRSRTQWAVDQAKNNVDQYFTFVGILEELEGSLEVMEYILPRYFIDARAVKNDPSNIKNDTFTLHKKPPSDETKEFLRRETSIQLEYDLYHYVRAKYDQVRKGLRLD